MYKYIKSKYIVGILQTCFNSAYKDHLLSHILMIPKLMLQYKFILVYITFIIH